MCDPLPASGTNSGRAEAGFDPGLWSDGNRDLQIFEIETLDFRLLGQPTLTPHPHQDGVERDEADECDIYDVQGGTDLFKVSLNAVGRLP